MTTKHRPMIHSGFLDLVDLFSHTSFKPNKLTSPVNVDSAVTHTVSGDGAQEGIAQVRQDDKPGEHEEGRRGVAGSSGAENALRAAAGTPMPLDVGREVISVANGAAGTGSGIPAQAVAAGASDPSKDKRRISRVPVPLPPPAPSGPTRPAIHNQVSRGKGNGQAGLRYRKINKRDISYPTHFRHVFHASTYEEAAELLMRWSIEGLDNKMGDPAWVHPLKEVVQARAKEQQALAIAQVVEATAWSKTVGRYTKQKLAPGQLHVVNGLPSSVYSTTNNTLTPRTASALPLAPLSSSLDRVREAEGDESAPAGKQSGYFSSRTAVREKRDGTAQKDHGSGRVEEPSIAELLAQAETPMLIANMPSTMGMGSAAPFRLTGTSVGEIKGSGYPVNPFMPPAVDSSSPQTAGAVAPADDPPPSATTTGPDSAAVEQQAALTTNPVSALAAESNIAPTPRIRPSPPRQPLGARAPPHLKRRVSPIQIKKKALIPAPTESVEQAYMDRSADLGNRDKLKIDADGRVPRDGSTDSGRTETGKSPSSPTFPPFRVIEPSLPTLERAMSIALYFEQYYHGLFKVHPIIGESTTSGNAPASTADMDKAKGDRLDPTGTHLAGRAQRQAELEEQLASMNGVIMSEEEKQQRRRQWQREENRLLRERRRKVDVQAFEMGRVIGHGAFGVVRIAREKSSGGLMAIKQLRKADMLRKSQEGHIKAEKDVLAAAATRSAAAATSSGFGASSWIVKLHYAFQDIDNLYLVLDYMGGGDLLNLLVALDTFSESMTRFYMAEMILSLAETHRLGYIHRDIKPDNFLFTPEGHVRVSDFGLATDLHWAHDTNHYQHQREALLKKHGVDLEYPAPSGTVRKRMRKKDVERIMGKEWVEKGEGVLSWRDRNRRSLAYSVCGTNSYMAPEVIRGQGYGFSCDWWSLGVIMYECLYGYPPFVSNSRHATRQKILNWKTNLKFPPAYQVSKQCVDFMTRLLCEPEDRLGSEGRPVGVGRSSSILGARSASGFFRSADSSAGNGQGGEKGLGSDGVEQIKAHPWFAGIDWHRLHLQPAPYNPALAAEDDTKHFDTDIPDEPLAAPNGMTSDATRDPMLGHSKHGKQLLEIRKELAFKGWTYKSPTAGGDSRYGHMTYLSSGGSSDEGTAGHAEVPLEFGGHCGGEAEEAEMEAERLGLHMPMTGTVMIRGGTVRGRALSL